MASFPMIALIVGGLLCTCNVARAVPDTTPVQKTCNGEKYQNPTAYYYNVLDVIFDLSSNTPSHSYDYYDQFSLGGSPCNGYGNGGLTANDCSACCIGVRFQLKDCRLRYENYYFVE
ncbi:hypothetical protein ACJRO7_034017 [Eucalyptus globulus]|uniref:Gnk2-homologous domain-containing protein n=1 Tax=Eucalyptus globulus TaxID=34317 RepID=A0ABD3J533_EUCGL